MKLIQPTLDTGQRKKRALLDLIVQNMSTPDLIVLQNMSSPFNTFMHDLLNAAGTRASSAVVVVDNARIRLASKPRRERLVQKIKRQRLAVKPDLAKGKRPSRRTLKGALDVSDHEKGETRWHAPTMKANDGCLSPPTRPSRRKAVDFAVNVPEAEKATRTNYFGRGKIDENGSLPMSLPTQLRNVALVETSRTHFSLESSLDEALEIATSH
jgi:hypothetical protein